MMVLISRCVQALPTGVGSWTGETQAPAWEENAYGSFQLRGGKQAEGERSCVKMMAAEFLRASITLTIAVVRPAQERSEGNYGCGAAITFCFSTSFPLAAASQLLVKNKGSVS